MMTGSQVVIISLDIEKSSFHFDDHRLWIDDSPDRFRIRSIYRTYFQNYISLP